MRYLPRLCAKPSAKLFAVSILVLATAAAPLWTPTVPCRAQAAADATAPVTPEQRAAALAGARELIGKMGQVKSFTGFADILTNKSAGAMGLFLTAMASMMVSFSDMPGAKSDSDVPPAQMKSDYDALLARYGLSDDKMSSNDATLPPTILQNGRQFLVDVGTFLDKIGKKGDSSFHGNDAPKVDEITYTVLSPTHVKLTMKPKPGKKTDPPLDAIIEDGQWRLDLGDIKKLFASTTGPSAPSSSTPRPSGILSTDSSPLAKSFFAAVNDHKTSVVKTMLRQHPGLVKAVDSTGETALFQSIFFEDLPTTRVLIAAGADVNAHADSGKVPLDDALFFHKDDPALLALLRKHGAKPSPVKH